MLREYLAVTSWLNVQGSGQSQADILNNLQTVQSNWRVVEDNLPVFSVLTDLVQNYNFAGRQVYDANIAATMQIYGITNLLTLNVSDFNHFAGIITIATLVGSTP